MKLGLHILSIALMATTLQLAYYLNPEVAYYAIFLLGCWSFGGIWYKLTRYLIDLYETNTQNRV